LTWYPNGYDIVISPTYSGCPQPKTKIVGNSIEFENIDELHDEVLLFELIPQQD